MQPRWIPISQALILFCAGTLSGPAGLGAEPDWMLRSTSGPPARYRHRMAYDSRREVAVLFGGASISTPNAPFSDTWEWNGQTWTQRAVTGPPSRLDHAMAYDSTRGVAVLFGGYRDGTHFGDTWEWTGDNWLPQAVAGPSPRSGAALAFDSTRGVAVLFGGDPDNRETWEWNGQQWSLRATGGPEPRRFAGMAFDSGRNVCVLFGGRAGPSMLLSDTWEWNGLNWTLRSQTGPARRSYMSIAYDSGRGMTVLFSGFTPVPDELTWEWDGAAWTSRLTPHRPSSRSHAAMVYDIRRKVMTLFSGSTVADTWDYVVPRPMLPGDLDDDGFVDRHDMELFNACATGPTIMYVPGALPVECTLAPDGTGILAADLDTDGDVDGEDFGLFQRCYRGSNAPAAPECGS